MLRVMSSLEQNRRVWIVLDELDSLNTIPKLTEGMTMMRSSGNVLVLGMQNTAQLEDRYGPAPEAVRSLLKFSALKGSAQQLGIEAIDRRAGVLNVKFHKEAHIDPKRLMSLVTGTEGAQFTPAGVLRLPLDGASTAAKVLDLLEGQLQQLQ